MTNELYEFCLLEVSINIHKLCNKHLIILDSNIMYSGCWNAEELHHIVWWWTLYLNCFSVVPQDLRKNYIILITAFEWYEKHGALCFKFLMLSDD